MNYAICITGLAGSGKNLVGNSILRCNNGTDHLFIANTHTNRGPRPYDPKTIKTHCNMPNEQIERGVSSTYTYTDIDGSLKSYSYELEAMQSKSYLAICTVEQMLKLHHMVKNGNDFQVIPIIVDTDIFYRYLLSLRKLDSNSQSHNHDLMIVVDDLCDHARDDDISDIIIWDHLYCRIPNEMKNSNNVIISQLFSEFEHDVKYHDCINDILPGLHLSTFSSRNKSDATDEVARAIHMMLAEEWRSRDLPHPREIKFNGISFADINNNLDELYDKYITTN